MKQRCRLILKGASVTVAVFVVAMMSGCYGVPERPNSNRSGELKAIVLEAFDGKVEYCRIALRVHTVETDYPLNNYSHAWVYEGEYKLEGVGAPIDVHLRATDAVDRLSGQVQGAYSPDARRLSTEQFMELVAVYSEATTTPVAEVISFQDLASKMGKSSPADIAAGDKVYDSGRLWYVVPVSDDANPPASEEFVFYANEDGTSFERVRGIGTGSMGSLDL